jgi:CBS domain-containing protein
MTTHLIKNIMTSNVLTVQADWSLDQLAEFFIDNYISGAPVVNKDDELIGVVSLTDVVRHDSLRVNELEKNDPHEYYIRGLESRYAQEEIKSLRIRTQSPVTVRDIMTPIVFDIKEDATVQQVADTMIRGHIHRVFVTRDKKIVGIVTALDMLKIVRDL